MLACFLAPSTLVAATIEPLVRVIDLDVGETHQITLHDGTKATVTLLELAEKRDSVRNAVRKAQVKVKVNGQTTSLVSSTYHLPTAIGGVQIDCPVTKGYLQNSSKANAYGQLLQDTDILLPAEAEPARHVYHLYVVRSRHRDALREYLASQGVMTGIHYPVPIHLQEGYRFLGYDAGDLPVTESATEQILSLPVYPELTDGEIECVGEHIVSFDKNKD